MREKGERKKLKKSPDLELAKMPLSLFFVGRPLLGIQPSCNNSLFPWWDSFGKNKIFICKWLSPGNNFWVRDGGLGPLLLSALRPYPVQSCAGPVHAASFLCHFGPVVLRWPCFLAGLQSPWFSHYSCLFLFRVPWAWRERFDWDILLRAEWPKFSHSLGVVLLWASLFVLICCRRKLLWWWVRKAQSFSTAELT